MLYVFLSIQDVILSFIALIIFGFVIFFLFFYTKKEAKRQKSDKYLLINDVVKYDKLYQLINYRIENKKEELYFSLMMISIDQFNQIKEYVSEEGIREFNYKIITYIRINLPKGSKIAQLDSKDTFLVYLPEIYEEKEFFKLAEAFKASVEKKITVLKNINIKKTASLSLAYYPHDGETFEQIYTNLHNALIQVQKYGGNAIALYQEDMKKDDDYYKAYNHLVESIDDGNLIINSKDIYNPNINKKIGSSSHLHLRENDKVFTYKELIKTLEQFNDDLWMGLYYFEKTISTNINAFQELGSKQYFIFIENAIKMYEYSDLFGRYIDLIGKYKIDASKFVFEIVDFFSNTNNQKALKNIRNLKELGFKFCVEIDDVNEELLRLLEEIDFNIIKIDVKRVNKEIVNRLNDKVIYVYNVNTEAEDMLVKELKIELVEGDFYLNE